MITGEARTGQKLETRVSYSLLTALETRKEWKSTQRKGALTQTPDTVRETSKLRALGDQVGLFQSGPRGCLGFRLPPLEVFFLYTAHFWGARAQFSLDWKSLGVHMSMLRTF